MEVPDTDFKTLWSQLWAPAWMVYVLNVVVAIGLLSTGGFAFGESLVEEVLTEVAFCSSGLVQQMHKKGAIMKMNFFIAQLVFLKVDY
jgi:hypothetical protein